MLKSEDATSAEPIFTKLHHPLPYFPTTTSHASFPSFICYFSTNPSLIIRKLTRHSLNTPQFLPAQCTPVALHRELRQQSSERASGPAHAPIALCSGPPRPSASLSPYVPYRPRRHHRTLRRTTRLLASTLRKQANHSLVKSRRPTSSRNRFLRKRTPLFPNQVRRPTPRHPPRMSKR